MIVCFIILLSLHIVNVNTSTFNARIVGGKNASITDHPYMMSLQYRGQHICSAFRLYKNLAGTAAQCVYGLPVEELSVRTGSSFKDSGGSIHGIYDVDYDRRYNPRTLDYDEGVFYIKDYENNNEEHNIPLFSKNIKIEDGGFGIVTGWGKTLIGEPFSDQLQVVELPVVNHKVCQRSYPRLTTRQFCAGYMSGLKGTCYGDSGSPILINKTFSGWFSYSYGCADPSYPAVFTEFLPESESIIKKHVNQMINNNM